MRMYIFHCFLLAFCALGSIAAKAEEKVFDTPTLDRIAQTARSGSAMVRQHPSPFSMRTARFLATRSTFAVLWWKN